MTSAVAISLIARDCDYSRLNIYSPFRRWQLLVGCSGWKVISVLSLPRTIQHRFSGNSRLPSVVVQIDSSLNSLFSRSTFLFMFVSRLVGTFVRTKTEDVLSPYKCCVKNLEKHDKRRVITLSLKTIFKQMLWFTFIKFRSLLCIFI